MFFCPIKLQAFTTLSLLSLVSVIVTKLCSHSSHLKNLVTNITRVKSINGSSIDVFLTNKITNFHHTVAFESGLSDSHKIILTFFRVHINRFPHKNIEYQSFKKFYKDHFLHELDFEFSKGTTYKVKDNQYDILTNIFRILLDKYAPIKSKKIEEITCLLCQRNWVKKLKRNCFIEITSKGVTGNKDFWNVVKTLSNTQRLSK